MNETNRYNSQQNMITIEPRPLARHPLPIAMPSLPEQRITVPERGYVNRLNGEHDPITMAQASQIHARGDIAVFGGITVAVVLLMWWLLAANLVLFGILGLLAWGGASYYALHHNREASYAHSPAGVALREQGVNETVALAEIASRERVTMHAIDASIACIKAHYRIEG